MLLRGWLGMACASTLLGLALIASGCGVDDKTEPPDGEGGSGGDDGGGSGSGSSGSGAGSGGSGRAGSGGTGSEPTGMAGSGGSGGSAADPCADVEDSCEIAGTSCDGDNLVTCEENDDGCLVATTEDCTDDADFCDDSGSDASCESCEDSDCDEESVDCDGETLVTCAEDANGCLVETRTNCTSGSNDYCDEDAATPVCKACAANDCEEEGLSCDDETLVTCTEDDNGCFERDTEDCTTVGDNNWCSESPSPAHCTEEACRESDGTPKEGQCLIDETMCVDNTLVTCEDDDDGCPMAESIDCTMDGGNNACNEETLMCWVDPCIGVTDCTTAGTTCRGASTVTCAANLDGCLVEDIEDCTDGGNLPDKTCDPAPPHDCVDCVNDTACVGQVDGYTDCTSNVLTTCDNTDADSCLEAVVEDCGDDFECDAVDGCVYSGGDDCDEELDDAHVLRAEGHLGQFTTTGEVNEYSSYVCPGIQAGFPFLGASPDMLFALDVPAGYAIEVSFSTVAGFNSAGGPWMLLLPSCADTGTATAQQAERMCSAFSFTSLAWHVLPGREHAAGGLRRRPARRRRRVRRRQLPRR